MNAFIDDNGILVGNKPFMNYVTGVMVQFSKSNVEEVILKARGKFISRAVDVAEVATKRFLDNAIEIVNIMTGSESFRNDEGRKVRVSTIEITLKKR